MSGTMRAAVCTALTGIDSLRIEPVAVPAPGAGEALIAVAAAGLNYPDLLMLSGRYQHRPEPPFVRGLEGAGHVVAVGNGVDAATLGRAVMFSARGTFAPFAVAPTAELLPIPTDWSMAEAGAFPVIAKTAFHALVQRAALQTGESLVVHGASGGTGHMAVKIGKALGAHVVATTAGPAKTDTLRALGADQVVDGSAPDLSERLRAACGGRGADVVFDPVGGAVFEASLKAARFGARILIVGFVADVPNSVRTNYALIKGLSILGVRAGEAARRDPRIAASYARELPALAASHDLKPRIAATFRLEEAADAFRLLASRRFTGKIILRPSA